MKFYIKCLVDFRPKKVIIRGPEDLTEQELRHRLNKRFPKCPVTQIEIVAKEAEK